MDYKEWTENELNLIQSLNNKCNSIEELNSYFPYRGLGSITGKKEELHIHLKKHKNIKRKYDQRFKFFKDNFGIILDYDLCFAKYDIVQWWKWNYFGINNKCICCIPQEMLSQSNINKLFVFILSNYENINIYDKSDICNHVTFHMLEKYKIFFKLFNHMSLLEILRFVFPKYNISEFDLKSLPKNFWKDKNNFNKYVEYVLFNVANISNIKNIKQNLYSILKSPEVYSHTYLINKNINKYHHYLDLYDCLNSLHPEFNLQSKDFLSFIGIDDKTVLSSYEEKSVFDYIYAKLNLKYIKASGNTMNKQLKFKANNGVDNFYYADFIIEKLKINHKINILNKPIVIEYFGLLKEQGNKNGMFESYENKMNRKKVFFKNNSNINFIDLYPKDIKFNFEGVKNKIMLCLLQKCDICYNIQS